MAKANVSQTPIFGLRVLRSAGSNFVDFCPIFAAGCWSAARMVHCARALVFLILLVPALSLAPIGPALARPEKAASVSPADRKTAQVISAVRKRHGAGAVRIDPVLVAAARKQAEAMAKADRLSHDVAGDFGARMLAAGFRYGSSWENLGMGYATLDEAIDGWLASPGHRANLLTQSATRIGLASAVRRSAVGARTYWALILADDAKPPPTLGDAGSPFSFGSGMR